MEMTGAQILVEGMLREGVEKALRLRWGYHLPFGRRTARYATAGLHAGPQ